jgi:PKHD-type hydroxylase
MDNYLEVDLLSKETIDSIVDYFPLCNWESGSENGGHRYKINLEMVKDENYDVVDNKLINGFRCSRDAKTFTMPSSLTATIFSKMGVGGQYPIHTDASFLGHYSMTTFLSNPEDYDGGELQLYLNGSIKSFKLERGRCIIYHTGTPHAVSKVTRGERLVGVNWILSSYIDTDLRDIARNIKRMMDYYSDLNEDTSELSYEEMMNHPQFILKDILTGFERRFDTMKSRGMDNNML